MLRLPSRFTSSPKRWQNGLASDLRGDGLFSQPLVNTWRRDPNVRGIFVTKTEQAAIPRFWADFRDRPPGDALFRTSPKRRVATARQGSMGRL